MLSLFFQIPIPFPETKVFLFLNSKEVINNQQRTNKSHLQEEFFLNSWQMSVPNIEDIRKSSAPPKAVKIPAKLQIYGINVEFPATPYDCQIAYMSKVIEAIIQRKNAMLESPTGTGKTLCLLCASLAWQQGVKSGNLSDHPGTIIYATRTHNQLTQVVEELRNTAYRPRMAILGSRDQLCVHERISKLKGSALNNACNSITAKHACLYRNNLDGFVDGNVSNTNEILDIEDLVKMGSKKKICSYFYSRDYSTNAEIIFMPYNYLLDGSIRKTLKLNFDNSIVIFDEAHNLERVAADSASFSMTTTDIASCIQELQQVLRILKEAESINATNNNNNNNNNNSSSSSATDNMHIVIDTNNKPDLAITVKLLKSMFELEQQIDNIVLRPNEVGETTAAKFDGIWLVDVFLACGFQDILVSFLWTVNTI
jgi:Rad3-related DNA helicase